MSSKIIDGFPNYSISTTGIVTNIVTERVMKLIKNTDGYFRVDLYNKGERKKMLIHRLVALHFIPNIDNKLTVDHIDRNKTNNNIENLRWATRTEQNNNKSTTTNNIINHHIYPTKSNTFQVQFKINGKFQSKNFKTIEEAIIYRDNYILENQLII